MSKKKKKKTISEKKALKTQDSFSNPLARLGYGTPNLLESTEYVKNDITRDYIQLNTLYRQNWIIERLIKTIPQDMLKNWYKIETNLDPSQLKELSRVERQTGIRGSILEALQWGRLYGGAAAVMMIDGHDDILHYPLDYDLIMPDSFKGLLVFDRWCGIYPSSELVDDISDRDFGLPKYYTITDDVNHKGVTVHHSRVLRFIGKKLPYLDEISEMHWGSSIVETIYQELTKYDNTSYNVAALVFKACLRIYAMEDMEQIGMMDEESLKVFYDTLMGMNHVMNNQGMQIISSKDRLETQQYSFAGLKDVLDTFMLDISGAAGIPVTKLFQREPAGMNATGESDMQNYYDSIEQFQESELRPIFDRLLPVMFMSIFGAIPDDYEYSFVDCRRPTEEEKKNISTQVSNAIVSTFNAGIINKKIALKELSNSKEMTNMWASITDEDIENATDDDYIGGEDIPYNLMNQATIA